MFGTVPEPKAQEFANNTKTEFSQIILSGHGQRGLFVRTPFWYCLQTLAPWVPAPFQTFGAWATVSTSTRLVCVHKLPIVELKPQISVMLASRQLVQDALLTIEKGILGCSV